MLWNFTPYKQINLHHDSALLAQEPTLINQWFPATSWSCMNFDDQLQVTAGKKKLDNCSRKDKIILREQKDEKNRRGQKSLCNKLISKKCDIKIAEV